MLRSECEYQVLQLVGQTSCFIWDLGSDVGLAQMFELAYKSGLPKNLCWALFLIISHVVEGCLAKSEVGWPIAIVFSSGFGVFGFLVMSFPALKMGSDLNYFCLGS